MKVSVVTAVYNDPRIGRALDSLQMQNVAVESIVVDGGDDEATWDAIEARADIDVLIRGPDRGIYDAMNKGIEASSGDVVAILNADDRYAAPDVLRRAVAPLQGGVGATYGDIVVEDRSRVVRNWRGGSGSWRAGWMPPHPSLVVRREVYDEVGLFRQDMSFTADYEWMVRAFVAGGVRLDYVPQTVVRMAAGGASQPGLRTVLTGWRQSRRAWRENGLRGGLAAATLKPVRKIPQVFSRSARPTRR